MKRYFCPACQEELSHTQTDMINRNPDELAATSWYRVHFECMTCPEILSIIVDVPRVQDLPAPCTGMPIRRHVKSMDSRDDRTTWIWISSSEYVEVDPVELHHNMLMNCCCEQED